MQITKNLFIESINPYHQLDVIRHYEISFSYCGNDGFSAWIMARDLDNEDHTYSLVKSEIGDFHDHFIDEICDNWGKIVESVKNLDNGGEE